MDDEDKITPHDDAHDGFHVVIDPKHQDPIPAEIVGDRRDTIGKRLAIAGIFALILFLLISAYKQAVKNGDRPTPRPQVTTVVVPSPVVSVSPVPTPTVIVVPSGRSQETFGPPSRSSSAPRPAPAPRRTTKPRPKPTPKPTCVLPAPLPCAQRLLP